MRIGNREKEQGTREKKGGKKEKTQLFYVSLLFLCFYFSFHPHGLQGTGHVLARRCLELFCFV